MKWFFSKEKDDFFLVLDIGTTAVKSLFCYKNKENKLFILSGSAKNFSEYKYGNELDIKSAKEAVLDSFNSGLKNISFSLIEKSIKTRAERQKKWKAVIGPSPDVLKAKVIVRKTERDNYRKKISASEERSIFESVVGAAEKEVLNEFCLKSGILSKDIHFISSKIFDVKIDGYPVFSVTGYEGKEIEMKIMFTFIPLSYWQALMEIVGALKKKTKIFSIVHLAEVLLSLQAINSGLFLDVGGKCSQYFRIKNSQLSELSDFDFGGSAFFDALSSDLGIGSDMAENMIELYSKKLLSAETSIKIRSVFSIVKNNWYNKLIEELKSKNGSVFSPYVYLFGGASALPEIQDVFKDKANDSEKDLYISGPPEINFFLPNDLKKNIEDTTKKINTPQWTPAVLIANKYAKENI